MAGSCAKTLTPGDPGVECGEKNGRGEPSKVHCTFEGKAIKSAECPNWPPNIAWTLDQAEGDDLASCKDKMREGASTGLYAEGI